MSSQLARGELGTVQAILPYLCGEDLLSHYLDGLLSEQGKRLRAGKWRDPDVLGQRQVLKGKPLGIVDEFEVLVGVEGLWLGRGCWPQVIVDDWLECQIGQRG